MRHSVKRVGSAKAEPKIIALKPVNTKSERNAINLGAACGADQSK
jgi:hypothetical protein